MAIDPAGRFPLVPTQAGQAPLPAQSAVADSRTAEDVADRGRRARGIERPATELRAETVDERRGEGRTSSGFAIRLENVSPNAPRGSILNILV